MSFRVELKVSQQATKAEHFHSVSSFSAIVLKRLADESHKMLVCCTVCCVSLCRFRGAFGLGDSSVTCRRVWACSHRHWSRGQRKWRVSTSVVISAEVGGWHVNRRKYPAKLEQRVKDPISTFWGPNSNLPQCSSSSATFVLLGRLQAWRKRLELQVVVSIVDRSSCFGVWCQLVQMVRRLRATSR